MHAQRCLPVTFAAVLRPGIRPRERLRLLGPIREVQTIQLSTLRTMSRPPGAIMCTVCGCARDTCAAPLCALRIQPGMRAQYRQAGHRPRCFEGQGRGLQESVTLSLISRCLWPHSCLRGGPRRSWLYPCARPRHARPAALRQVQKPHIDLNAGRNPGSRERSQVARALKPAPAVPCALCGQSQSHGT